MKGMNKKCCRCGEIKPETEFYPRSDRPGKRVSQCRSCRVIIERQRLQNPEAKQKKLAYKRKWVRSENGKRSSRKYYRTLLKTQPNKVLARKAINRLVEKGLTPTVATLSCVECGNNAEHYHHHEGYEPQNWINVKPVCRNCHKNIHAPN